LIPSLKKSRPVLIVTIIAIAAHSLLHYLPLFRGLSTGWSIIIATVFAAVTGAIFYPKGVLE
jgi:hypothetical protein